MKEVIKKYDAVYKLVKYEREKRWGINEIRKFTGIRIGKIEAQEYVNLPLIINIDELNTVSEATEEDKKRRQSEQCQRYLDYLQKDMLTPQWRRYGEKHSREISDILRARRLQGMIFVKDLIPESVHKELSSIA